jgi:hypothetical protein
MSSILSPVPPNMSELFEAFCAESVVATPPASPSIPTVAAKVSKVTARQICRAARVLQRSSQSSRHERFFSNFEETSRIVRSVMLIAKFEIGCIRSIYRMMTDADRVSFFEWSLSIPQELARRGYTEAGVLQLSPAAGLLDELYKSLSDCLSRIGRVEILLQRIGGRSADTRMPFAAKVLRKRWKKHIDETLSEVEKIALQVEAMQWPDCLNNVGGQTISSVLRSIRSHTRGVLGCRANLDGLREPAKRPDFREFFEELQAMARDYPSFEIREVFHDEDDFGVRTGSNPDDKTKLLELRASSPKIVIHELNFGVFSVRFRLDNHDIFQANHFCTFALTPLPPADSDSSSARHAMTHPHVFEDHLCTGDDGGAFINAALIEGRISDAYLMMMTILQNYDSGTAYGAGLGTWTDEIEDEYFTCNCCEQDDCYSRGYCESCQDDYTCEDCISTCYDCGESVCNSCLVECNRCQDRSVCSSCALRVFGRPLSGAYCSECVIQCVNCRSFYLPKSDTDDSQVCVECLARHQQLQTQNGLKIDVESNDSVSQGVPEVAVSVPRIENGSSRVRDLVTC